MSELETEEKNEITLFSYEIIIIDKLKHKYINIYMFMIFRKENDNIL